MRAVRPSVVMSRTISFASVIRRQPKGWSEFATTHMLKYWLLAP